jgi:hypothetical protein
VAEAVATVVEFALAPDAEPSVAQVEADLDLAVAEPEGGTDCAVVVVGRDSSGVVLPLTSC